MKEARGEAGHCYTCSLLLVVHVTGFVIMSLTESNPLDAAKSASIASRTLATLPVEIRNEALLAIHDALREGRNEILDANRRDLQTAGKAAEDGELSQSVVKRLDLGKAGKFEDMLKGILDVRGLPDPGRHGLLTSFLGLVR